jgi:hypothetical protein
VTPELERLRQEDGELRGQPGLCSKTLSSKNKIIIYFI